MAKITTVKVDNDALRFSYTISSDSYGVFSTTIPKDVVDKLLQSNVDLKQNRLGHYGYFSSDTLAGLKGQVDHIIQEYLSREMVSEKIVIRYVITTMCTYCMDVNGNVVPNGNPGWTKMDTYDWKEGTISQDVCRPNPYGILVYVQPFIRQDYKYRSGKEKTEYVAIDKNDPIIEDEYYLHWLNNVVAIKPPSDKVCEIDYTEKRAKFFVTLIISICELNERIKPYLDPDALLKVIDKGQRFLP
jgi:hypothetical protein